MKALLGFVGLLLVVAIVGLLARKQLSATVPSLPAAVTGATGAAPQATASPRQQVEQIKQAVEAGMQQPAREMPDDTR